MAESAERVPGKDMRANKILWLYAVVVWGMTAVAWVTYARHPQVRTIRPLFIVSDRYHDLTGYRDKIEHLRDGAAALARGLPVFNYPAPAAYVYKLFLHGFGGHASDAYLLFLSICAVGYATETWRATGMKPGRGLGTVVAIVTTATLGFPLWFTADRANLEGVVWAVSAAGLCLVLRRRYLWAAVCFGVATSIKPFPALFVLLLVRQRRYREAAVACVVAGAITTAALASLGPNPLKAYDDLKPGLALYMDRYVMNVSSVEEIRFNHSLLDGMKSATLMVETGSYSPLAMIHTVGRISGTEEGHSRVAPDVHWYWLAAGSVLALILIAFYNKPIANQITALCIAVTMLPLSSSEYTLLHLYVPVMVFIVYLAGTAGAPKAQSLPLIASIAIVYGLLMAPLTELAIYAGDLQFLLLVLLLFLVARLPMRGVGDRHAEDAVRG